MPLFKRNSIKVVLIASSCLLGSGIANATDYYFPGSGSLTAAVAPQTLAGGDTLRVNSGTLQTTNSTIYTVNTLGTATINTQAGSSISYAGNNTSGAALYTDTANAADTQLFNIRGTISKGTGGYAIYYRNSNASNSDSVRINLYSGAVINGDIASYNTSATFNSYNIQIAGDVQILGNLYGSNGQPFYGTAFSNAMYGGLGIGEDSNGVAFPGTSFVTQGELNIIILNVFSSCSCTINYPATVAAIQGGSNANVYINNLVTASQIDLTGANNNLIVSANLNMTGALNTIESYNFIATKPITVTFDATVGSRIFDIDNTYISRLHDQLNYGQLNLRLSSGTVTIPAINVQYTGGYLAGGSYSLFSSDIANSTSTTVGSIPTNTMFLSFSTPDIFSNQITMLITRTPFQAIATNSTAQDIGTSLEYIGGHYPNTSNMAILNVLETSTSADQLNDYLLQLAPLASATTQSLNVQNLSIRQPMTRLADTRSYSAGDGYADKNVWIRPFGDSVTQHTINSINGYNAKTAGIALGFDKDFNPVTTVGVAVSYAYAQITDKVHSNSHTYLDSYQGMVYGSMFFAEDDSLYWDWLGAMAHNSYDGIRNISLNTLNLTTRSEYGNNNYSVLSVLGKAYQMSRKNKIMPELSAQYTFINGYSYTESGAPGANLFVNKPDSNIIQLGAWLRSTSLVECKNGDLIPEAHIAGLYNVLNTNQDIGFQFVDGGGQILSNMGPNNGAVRIGGALTFATLNNLELKLNFDVELQNLYTDYSAYFNVHYVF